MDAQPAAIPLIGRTVSRYHIVELLGTGGMGVVYKAKDIRLGRTVALKFISDAFADDPVALRQFEREAQTASSLNHPHICTVFQVDEFEGQPFIAMELLRGQTLKQRLAASPVEAVELIDLAIQISDALDAAHEKGIVHRDVKPANIFINERGQVKLLDFGLAKGASVVELDSQDADNSSFTAAGRVLGTVNYMSPERLLGHGIDHRSDLFSLGAVLYEMATGSHAFQGDSVIDTIDAILHRDPPIGKRVPQPLTRVISRLLEKEPEDRYQSAKAVMNALLNAREDIAAGRTEAIRLRPLPSTARASIAVLPFRNVGLAPDQEYFTDGLAEELITALTKIEGLRVAARTSTFTFKGRDVDVREIGERLRVDAVLEGSVRRAGNRLRVTCELVNAAQGYEIWSELYDREMADLFVLQDEITRAIVDKLKVALVDDLKAARRYTESRKAYHHYLKGRFYWSKRYEGGLKTAMEEFEQAILEDEGYALAYSGLADTLVFRGLYSIDPPRQAFAKAKEQVEKALAIDDALPEAHTSLGLIELSARWDWTAAEREFMRAIELDKNQPLAHLYYSWLLVMADRRWEAGVEVKRAQDLDPLSPLVNSGAGWMYYMSHDYDQAIVECQKCLEVDPNFLVGLYVMSMAHMEKGLFEEAIAYIERATAISGRAPFYLGLQGHVFAKAGKIIELQEVLAELDRISQTKRYLPPHSYVYIYCGLGSSDRALEWQEKACDDGAPPFYYLTPAVECLKHDPRHQSQMRRMRQGEAAHKVR